MAFPTVLVRLKRPSPSVVFDTYWQFASERQAVFHKRAAGLPEPWTDDPIFQKYRFTNAYRASDRVSQYLIKHVIYEGDQETQEVFFRTVLFKLFNKVATWELLTAELGRPTWAAYSYGLYDRVLSSAIESGNRIYSGAYIMPAGGRLDASGRKHRAHLKLLEKMMADRLPRKIFDSGNMAECFRLLRSYPMIGDFLAYQYTIDLNYGEPLNFSENDFVAPGPGARSGIHKCFETLGDYGENDVIKYFQETQCEHFERLELSFQSLWGRPLQLIDCQNLFCEVDKYSRVRHPYILGLGNRTRIKRLFRPSHSRVGYWYPPKWRINEKTPSGPFAA